MIFISLSLLFLPLALFLIPYCTKMSCESYKWMTNRTRDKRICRLIILLGNGQNHMPLYSKLYRWLDSRSYSYSPYWTGASLQLRLTREVFSNTNDFYLFIIIFPRMSLHCKLVPVQYREYEYGLFLGLLNETIMYRKEKNVRRNQVPPRFELGSLDSESRVLTITPWDPLQIEN